MPGADLKGLIAWLKANPGKASQGNPGTGGRRWCWIGGSGGPKTIHLIH
jgi:hypothetical protein